MPWDWGKNTYKIWGQICEVRFYFAARPGNKSLFQYSCGEFTRGSCLGVSDRNFRQEVGFDLVKWGGCGKSRRTNAERRDPGPEGEALVAAPVR